MDELDNSIPGNARAVLAEIAGALDRFQQSGEEWTVFINKMGLSQHDRQAIRDVLGQGGIRINLENSAEPAEWLESGIPGVWYGVFYDQSRNPVLETIEVVSFPRVAAAQPEDIIQGIDVLRQRLAEL